MKTKAFLMGLIFLMGLTSNIYAVIKPGPEPTPPGVTIGTIPGGTIPGGGTIPEGTPTIDPDSIDDPTATPTVTPTVTPTETIISHGTATATPTGTPQPPTGNPRRYYLPIIAK